MALLDYLLRKRKKSASVAKERLQIILAREHADRSGPDYLPNLKKDILAVVEKYVPIDYDQIQVTVDSHDNYEILELNITLPDAAAPTEGKPQGQSKQRVAT
jgi:cell division topological specificity factor